MMGGYAQQGENFWPRMHCKILTVHLDAEECYSFIIQTLRNVPGLTPEGTSLATSAQADVGSRRFIEQYLMGEMRREYV